MRYVTKENEAKARRLVNFDACGNIDVSGSVTGMQRRYGWQRGGQVRLGGYVYNVGSAGVARLRDAGLLRGDGGAA
jgi:hypothetical protein